MASCLRCFNNLKMTTFIILFLHACNLVSCIWTCIDKECIQEEKKSKNKLSCEPIKIHFNKLQINNSSSVASFPLGQVNYGIEVLDEGEEEQGDLRFMNLVSLRCELEKQGFFLPLKDVLTFALAKQENRTVSIDPESGAFFYHYSIDCAIPDTGPAQYRINMEPIKFQFSLEEPKCTPRDILLPLKSDGSNNLIHVGLPGQRRTEFHLNFSEGISINRDHFPSNLKIESDELGFRQIPHFDKYIDRIKSIGRSNTTEYDWTTFDKSSESIGAWSRQRHVQVGEGKAIQEVQVVGICEPVRIYTTTTISKVIDTTNNNCLFGTFPTKRNGCPLDTTVILDESMGVELEYWRPNSAGKNPIGLK